MIDHNDYEILDTRYVKKEDCMQAQRMVDARIDAEEKSLAVLNTKMNWLIGILSAIGMGVLGLCINILFA